MPVDSIASLPPRQLAAAGDRGWRAAEALALFVALPLALTLLVPPLWMARLLFPVLLISALWCRLRLARDPTFDRRQLRAGPGFHAGLRFVLGTILIFGPVVALAVWWLTPERFLSFPLRAPQIWLIVMCFYPLLSVYPQEIIWRTYFFHRFEPLLGPGLPTVLASAATFGCMHILFRNPYAVGLTLIGGLLFAFTYHRYRTTRLAWLEHALWGCLVFTVGLGEYFFLGGIARAMK